MAGSSWLITVLFAAPLLAQEAVDLSRLRAHPVAAVEDARDVPASVRRVVVERALDDVLAGLAVHDHLLVIETALGPRQPGVTNEGLASLAKITSLRRLAVQLAADVTADGLRQLAAVPRLERLELHGSNLTGEDLGVLQRFPNLHELVLRGPNVEDGGLAFVAGMPHLRAIDLSGHYGLTAEDLQPLQHLTNLRELVLRNVNGSWPFSRRLPTEDEADGVGADDSVIVHCAAMKQLRKLDLYQVQSVTDVGLAALAGLDELRWLDVTGLSAVSPEGFASLPVNLEVLRADQTSIGRAGLVRLSKLRECRLSWCTTLRDEDLAALTVAKDLEHLDLTYTKGMTPAAAAHLQQWTMLRDLTLFGAPWLRDEHLEILGGMRELRRLSIGGLLDITDAQLEHLGRLPHLEFFDLRGNKHVTEQGLRKLSEVPLRQVWLPRRLKAVAEELWPDAEKSFW